jgi:hypothetical protein
MIAFVYQQNHHMNMELLQITIHAYEKLPLDEEFINNQI